MSKHEINNTPAADEETFKRIVARNAANYGDYCTWLKANSDKLAEFDDGDSTSPTFLTFRCEDGRWRVLVKLSVFHATITVYPLPRNPERAMMMAARADFLYNNDCSCEHVVKSKKGKYIKGW